MKVALYMRVSTVDQSIEAQRHELHFEAARRKWEVVEEVSDTMSGSKSSRPGLDRVMTLARAGAIDAVACVKLDRMARSLVHFAQTMAMLEKLDVALICTSQGIDTTKVNAGSRFQMSVLSAVAEFERELIRERTRAGLAAARARGAKIGRPSPKLVGVDRLAVMAQWDADGSPGGYRGLGERLGGVGKMTAWRLWKARPTVEPATEIA